MIRAAIVLALALIALPAGAADQRAAPRAGAKAAKTCDTTKVHIGPRGGRYRLTRDCRKVYLRR